MRRDVGADAVHVGERRRSEHLGGRPTNHLDIGHQLHLLHLVRRSGVTTLAALHDRNLAAMFCDTVVVWLPGGLSPQARP